MKRVTISIPENLAKAVDNYVRNQELQPTLTEIIETALRQYLDACAPLRAATPFRITPAKCGSGHRDVSQTDDRDLADQ